MISAMVALGALAVAACSAPSGDEGPVSVDDPTLTSAGDIEDEKPATSETMGADASADAGGRDAAQIPDAGEARSLRRPSPPRPSWRS